MQLKINPSYCPRMNHQGDCEERCDAEIDASNMGLIGPTDILLGRGPTCYNNRANRMFRKLIKEHVVHYRNEVRRREKAALVELLVSKLDAKGFRFLHRSSAGKWVAAPHFLVKQKVGHGLRDARLSVTRNARNNNLLPKNSSPSAIEQKAHDDVAPLFIGEAKTALEKGSNKADTTDLITTGVDPECDNSQTMLQKCLKNMEASSSPLGMDSEHGGLSFNDCKVGESIDDWDNGFDDKNNMDLWPYPYPLSADSEVHQMLKHWEQSWDDTHDTVTLPDVSPSIGTTHNAHELDAVSMAWRMYASVYGQSFDDWFDGEPCQPLRCAVDDAHSLCHWFRNLA